MTGTKFEGIEWPDYVVIALYFIFVLAVGLFVSFSKSIKLKMDLTE